MRGYSTSCRDWLTTRRLNLSPLGAVVLALIGIFAAASFVEANEGFESANPKRGIRGYISQGSHSTISGYDTILSWIGLCANDCGVLPPVDGGAQDREWVQVGEYQGTFGAGPTISSPSNVHVYFETQDACDDYYVVDWNAPSSDPEFYQAKNNGNGLEAHTCKNGYTYHGYTFNMKKGSSANNPFTYSALQTVDGRADEVTEMHGSVSSPPRNYFGCSGRSPSLCDNTTYEMEVFNNGAWTYYDGLPNDAGTVGLCKDIYNEFWSFSTYGAPC